MSSVKYSVPRMEKFCRVVFEKFGFTATEAAEITDVLLLADLYGVKSHGVQRLIRYHKSIENGCVRVDAKPEIVFETPVSAVIDGAQGMGQLVSLFAMRKAMEKARKTGISFVTVRNSNHFGIAGYYTKMACDQGLMAICVTNSESIMVHTGSKKAVLGSNPIAFAMPADPVPFWFDAATTVVPKGKLEVYRKENKPLGDGWAVDETGKVCTDAQHVLDCIGNKQGGGILPVGGSEEASGSHKGYGFSMMCELLCSITSGGATANHHVRAKGQGSGTCHAFIVIDPAIFGDTEAIKAHLSSFLQELRDADRADENTPIYTHGEKEQLSYADKMQNGIDVDVSTLAEMVDTCNYLGLDVKEYLGEVDISNALPGYYQTLYNK